MVHNEPQQELPYNQFWSILACSISEHLASSMYIRTYESMDVCMYDIVGMYV